jgi:hypothetical protein
VLYYYNKQTMRMATAKQQNSVRACGKDDEKLRTHFKISKSSKNFENLPPSQERVCV